jgi:hypothetical protein
MGVWYDPPAELPIQEARADVARLISEWAPKDPKRAYPPSRDVGLDFSLLHPSIQPCARYIASTLASYEYFLMPVGYLETVAIESDSDLVKVREALYRRISFLENEKIHLKVLSRELMRIFEEYEQVVRSMPDGIEINQPEVDDYREKTERNFRRPPNVTPFYSTMYELLPNPGAVIEHILTVFLDGFFHDTAMMNLTAQRLYDNLRAAARLRAKPFEPYVSEARWENERGSDRVYDKRVLRTRVVERFALKEYPLPTKSDLPIKELVQTYLGGTAFDFRPEVDIPSNPDYPLIPIRFDTRTRFAHQHIIGGSGAGKTTLLEHMIAFDLQSVDQPSIIVIDPHSNLVKKLARTDYGHHDRYILIDPRDIEHPPAINVFDTGAIDSPIRQEQVAASLVQTFNYLFKGLDVDQTGKQKTLFAYIARLVVTLPNPTIRDLLQILKDPSPYAAAIQKLPDIARDFFLTDFPKSYSTTRLEVRQRLQSVTGSDILRRIFTSSVNKVDFLKEMNTGGVILVDCAEDVLAENGVLFGKFLIALILRAVKERMQIPESERRPCFVYIDEASKFFDENIDNFLTEARKAGVGLILAHHYLGQANSDLQSSLAASTAIKFACKPEAADTRSLAANMRTTPEFLLSRKAYNWAAYIRDVTPRAVSVALGKPPEIPELSESAYEAFLARNAARVSGGGDPVPPLSENSPQPPDKEPDEEW